MSILRRKILSSINLDYSFCIFMIDSFPSIHDTYDLLKNILICWIIRCFLCLRFWSLSALFYLNSIFKNYRKNKKVAALFWSCELTLCRTMMKKGFCNPDRPKLTVKNLITVTSNQKCLSAWSPPKSSCFQESKAASFLAALAGYFRTNGSLPMEREDLIFGCIKMTRTKLRCKGVCAK